MHSHDPYKSNAEFQRGFESILETAGGVDGVADFTRFVFPDANYSGRTVSAECCFDGATFARDASFSKARFEQGAIFSEAMFTQAAYFTGATFTQNVDFSRATFARNVAFTFAEFAQNANFGGGAFTQDADFSRARFAQIANFSFATFAKGVDFWFATFTQNAHFLGATFAQKANFNEAEFTRIADFGEARFLSVASFRETVFRRDEELVPGPEFSFAEFSRPEVVVFYETYLGQALFHNCDVSKLTFSLVEWRKRKGSGKRMVFEEEVDLIAVPDLKPGEGSVDERNYGLIAELYQQLKKNYDERRDYWTAGDFHYGEMEMKRLHARSRRTRWLHQNLGLAAWYKRLSEYGESYVRPSIWLLVILAVFTLLFPLAGLHSGEKPPQSVTTVATGGKTPQSIVTIATQQAPPAARELSYRHFSDFGSAYPGKWRGWAAFFGHSLMTTLYVAGFQKDLAYEPSYPWGRLLALAEVLLTSTLFALFLLAIRRQFKR
jgi:hypothetical protein